MNTAAVETLKTHQELEKEVHTLKDQNEGLKKENTILREQLRLLRAKTFAPSSEKLSALPEQGELFDLGSSEPDADEQENQEDTPKPKKRKTGRRPLPEHFERIQLNHFPEDAPCKQCGSSDFKTLPPDVQEELIHIPAVMKVLVHHYHKKMCLTCRSDEKKKTNIVSAPRAPRLLPGSQMGASLIAQVMTSKFVDGLPFYRIEKQMKRFGLNLGRNTMSHWLQVLMIFLKPMWKSMLQDALATGVLQMDETTVQVMREPKRDNKLKSFMWVIRGGPPDRGIILYKYAPTRKAEPAAEMLKGYQGVLQTDGYQVYQTLAKKNGFVLVGDMDHVRRGFADICKAEGKRKKLSYAAKTLKRINSIYHVEKEARQNGIVGDALLAKRNAEIKPALAELQQWLERLVGKVEPSFPLGKAVAYALRILPRMEAVFNDARIPISTQLVENAIRPFVIGRKNWLFAGSPDGAEASAVLYSFVETAKAHGWEPFHYLSWLFEELPKVTDHKKLDDLLPNRAAPRTVTFSN